MAKFRQIWSHCRLSSTRTARRPVCHEHQNLVKSLALRAFITFSLLKRCSRFEAFTQTEGLFTITCLRKKEMADTASSAAPKNALKSYREVLEYL